MNNQLVVYGANRGLAVLPNAVRAAVSSMQTAAQIIAYVKKTAWYLSKANSARKQILASLSGSGTRSTIKEIAPVTINTKIKPRAARVRPGKIAGAMRITHREYLGEIAGNTTFGCTSYKINPGLGGVFPWLSGIANNFEKYRINSMSLQFVSISATSERGRITLACDYDVLDELPANKVDLFQVAGAVESSIWSSERLTIKSSGVLFTRGGPVANSDLKTYDQGQLLIGVSNTANTNVIGEAFLEYDIELMIPQPAQCPSWTFSAGGGSFTDVSIVGSAVYALALTTPSPSTGLIIEGALNVIPTANNTLTFPLPGKYIVSGCIDIDSGTLTALSMGGTSTIVTWSTTVDNSRTTWMSTVTVLTPNSTYTTSFTGSGTGSITVLVSRSSAPTLLGV